MSSLTIPSPTSTKTMSESYVANSATTRWFGMQRTATAKSFATGCSASKPATRLGSAKLSAPSSGKRSACALSSATCTMMKLLSARDGRETLRLINASWRSVSAFASAKKKMT